MMCGMVRVRDYVPPVTCGLQVPGRRTAADRRRSPKMLRVLAGVRRASGGRNRGGCSVCEQWHASRQAPRPNPVPSPTWPGAKPHLTRCLAPSDPDTSHPVRGAAPSIPPAPPEHARKPFESIPVLATLCSPIRAVCGTITFAPKCRFGMRVIKGISTTGHPGVQHSAG